MTHHSTLRGARASLDHIPYELSKMEKLQAELETADMLIALRDLPTIQARGREMKAKVMAEIKKLTRTDEPTYTEMVQGAYMETVHDPDGSDYLDWQRSIHDGVSSAIWFESIEPESP